MVIDYKGYGDALALLYEDRVTAIVEETYKDPIKKITERRKVKTVENAPCRLSFNSSTHNKNEVGYTNVKRKDILTTPTNIVIPNGSDVEVTRADGTIYYYRFSDIPSVHQSHRRYELEKADKS